MSKIKVKKSLKVLFLSGLSIVLATPVLYLGWPVSAAGSATLSLSPASGSYLQGATLSIGIYENSGSEPVNAVQANLSYPDNLLDFAGIDNSSAFEIAAESSGGGGSVRIARGTLSPKTGNQLVATVRFTAAGSGTANINFAGGSSVVSATTNQNILTSTSGGSYSLTSPSSPPPAPPSPSPTPPPSPSPPGGSSPGPSPSPSVSPRSGLPPASRSVDTTGLAISEVAVSDLSQNTATITWKTAKAATSEVSYGLDAGYGISAIGSGMVTEHRVALEPKHLIAGTTYHFAIKSVDGAGNVAISPDATFRTKGVTLNVVVLNQDNGRVKGAKVSAAGVSAETDENGQAALADMPVGNQKLRVEYKSASIETIVQIDPLETGGQVQSATVKINAKDQLPLIVIIPAAGVGLLLLAGAALHYLRQRRADAKELARHFVVPLTPGPTASPAAPVDRSPKIIYPDNQSGGAPPAKQ